LVVRGISASEEVDELGDNGSGISTGKFSLVFWKAIWLLSYR
jgi:hypothetical protein